MEEDWCRNSNLIKEDCLFSAVCCVSSNDLYNFDCGSSVATEDSGIQLFHAASATNTAETKNRDLRCLSDSSVTLDDPTTTLSTLEQHLSLEMPSIFDIKTEPRDDYPNAPKSHSPSSSSSTSSPELENNGAATDIQTHFISSRSPYVNDGTFEVLHLPPVTHFSHSAASRVVSSGMSKCIGFSQPLTSEDSSPEESVLHMELRASVKSRSKMHEMAIKQRLITDQDPRSCGFIELSAEEKRTLLQEGFTLPTRLPLTKSEEEALKVVRRKIKNKLSAQESRRKRKEYMDALEHKVQCYYNENSALKLKMKHLEQSNRNLLMQLRKLQATVEGRSVVEHPSCPTPRVGATS